MRGEGEVMQRHRLTRYESGTRCSSCGSGSIRACNHCGMCGMYLCETCKDSQCLAKYCKHGTTLEGLCDVFCKDESEGK